MVIMLKKPIVKELASLRSRELFQAHGDKANFISMATT